MMLSIFHRLFGHLYAAAMTGALSAAERSYTKSEVRGRSQENPMPKGRRPRGVSPRPRSGAAADSARLQQQRNGWEDLPCMWGQGGRSRGVIPCPGQSWQLGGATPRPHAPMPEARGSGWEDQPDVQGAVAARAQEGLEELSHVEGQEGRGEEIPLVQGKEQRLRFAGVAVRDTPRPR